MITVYTYLCFSIFGYYDPDKKKRCLRKQNVLMFVMHLTAFLVMYLEKKGHKDSSVISDAGNASWRNHPVI